MRKTVDTLHDHRPTDAEVRAVLDRIALKGHILRRWRFEKEPGVWVIRVHYVPVDEDLLADTAAENDRWQT